MLRLAEAAAEADAAGADGWQSAVSIDVLRNHSGLANADLLWLNKEGLVEHRLETTRPKARRRTFRHSGPFKPTEATCFLLSPAGLRCVRRICDLIQGEAVVDDKPHWDPAAGDLTIGGALVKHLSERATAQRAVAAACQAAKWVNPIDSPFAKMPPKRRIHYLGKVLDDLNHGQREERLHFSALDKGLRLRWRACQPA